jgi:hypothetical protein
MEGNMVILSLIIEGKRVDLVPLPTSGRHHLALLYYSSPFFLLPPFPSSMRDETLLHLRLIVRPQILISPRVPEMSGPALKRGFLIILDYAM